MGGKRLMVNRLDGVSSSASLEMKERLQKLSHEGRQIIDLTIGEPDFNTPMTVRGAAIEAIGNGRTRYTSTLGVAELREEIILFNTRRYGVRRGQDEVLVTPGGKQALFYALSTILNEGDEVLILEPAWVSFRDIIKLAGGTPILVESTEDEAFVPPLERVAAHMSKRTKAIILNNPSNPTGAIFEEGFVRNLHCMCEEKGVHILADEVYSDIIFDNARFFSALQLEGSGIIVVNSLSKMAAMTGWRVGYMIADKQVIRRCAMMQQHTATCASSVGQFAAIAALRVHDEYAPGMARAYQERRDIVVGGIHSISGLGCFIPKGAFYVFVNVKKTGMTSVEAAEFFLEHAGVAMLPGSAFGKSGEGYLRLSFSTSEENLIASIRKMKEALGRRHE